MDTRRDFLVPESNCDWDYCEIPCAGAAPDDMIQKIEDENKPPYSEWLINDGHRPSWVGQ